MPFRVIVDVLLCSIQRQSNTFLCRVSHVFTGVYCLCTYIASLFVMNMEGIVMFLWLSGVVIREYAECPFTHRHLSDVCSAFTTRLTVRILQNIYSVTDHAYCIMSVSGQCTFVFQWSL